MARVTCAVGHADKVQKPTQDEYRISIDALASSVAVARAAVGHGFRRSEFAVGRKACNLQNSALIRHAIEALCSDRGLTLSVVRMDAVFDGHF